MQFNSVCFLNRENNTLFQQTAPSKFIDRVYLVLISAQNGWRYEIVIKFKQCLYYSPNYEKRQATKNMQWNSTVQFPIHCVALFWTSQNNSSSTFDLVTFQRLCIHFKQHKHKRKQKNTKRIANLLHMPRLGGVCLNIRTLDHRGCTESRSNHVFHKV